MTTTYAKERQQLLTYLRVQKLGGVLAGRKDSPQIATQTKIKPSIVIVLLHALRTEGVVTYSRADGWRLK